MQKEELYGRRVLINQALPAPFGLTGEKTMDERGRWVTCRRCNACLIKERVRLPSGAYYCPVCLNLGRVTSHDRFYHLAEPNQFTPPTNPCTWQGQLSPLQERVASEVAAGMAAHQHRLLWAVTGAGKTEMIFPALTGALKRGERVAVASPRVDVCLELYPRLQAAFAGVPIALLHGKNPAPYQYRQLTICTTHQLLRFYHAFDNLVIDEVDAFPFAGDPALLFATHQAIKEGGGLLFLTATPSKELLQQVHQKKLAVSYLPQRFHGHPLPQIQTVLVGKWRAKLTKGKLPNAVSAWLKQRVTKGQEFLLFLPHVADLAPVARALKENLGAVKFMTVHASDPQRLQKVQAMRERQLSFLVTTTILERGVTFPGIDVGVLGADEEVFSTAALVQIAGRVGRSKERPGGAVTFWVQENSRRIEEAKQQIKSMNWRARGVSK